MKVICIEDYEKEGKKILKNVIYEHRLNVLCRKSYNRRQSGTTFFYVSLTEYTKQTDALDNIPESQKVDCHYMIKIISCEYVVDTGNGVIRFNSHSDFIKKCKRIDRHRHKIISKLTK